MRKLLIDTESFDAGDGYTLDLIFKTKGTALLYEAWLSHNDYGIKKMMIEGPMVDKGLPIAEGDIIRKIEEEIEEYKADYAAEWLQ